MQKILLYYIFTPLADPEAIRLWQRTLCESLGLRGRIIISPHGLNGTVGGELKALKAYVRATKTYLPFKAITFKWSDGQGNDFPKLSVKVRDEVVSFGAADELQVDETGVVAGGKHLTPQALHQLMATRDDVVFFDGRNAHEAAIGAFKNAVVPDVSTSKDFIPELDSGKYDHLKDKPVVTYCTGGVRCEVLSRLMKRRGFRDVYQLDGGIVTYGKQFGDDGLWEGSLYVFDGRGSVRFSDASKDMGACIHCQAATSNYENCANQSCNKRMLVCDSCQLHNPACSLACLAVCLPESLPGN